MRVQGWIGLSIVVLALLAVLPTAVVWASTPSPPAPTPIPTPTHENDQDQGSGTVGRIIRYTLDPSQAIRDLIKELLEELFRDFVRFGAGAADEAWSIFQGQTRSGGWQAATYERVGATLRVVTAATFIVFAVLRLAWYHKSQLVGESDSVLAVIAEWIGVGLTAAFFPRLQDWTWDFSLRMARSILGAIEGGTQGMTPGTMLLQALGLGYSLSLPFFLLIVTILLMGVMYGIVAAYFAIQAASFVFATLAPILLAFSLLPPFRFVRRFLAMAYLLMLITPSIAALALVAASWLPFSHVTENAFMGVILRIVWLATMMGLLLKSASILGSVGLDAAKGMVAATVKAVTTAAVTLGAGALLGGAVAAGATGAAAGAGTGAAAGAGTGAAASAGSGATASTGGAATAASRFQTAANLADMAGVVAGRGRLGFAARALGRYYRSLAQTQLRQSRGQGIQQNAEQSGGDASPAAHTRGFQTARQLGMPGGYATYVGTLSQIQDLLQDQKDANGLPIQPVIWSQYNTDEADISGALATLYRENPRKFETVLEKEGWPGLRRLAEERLSASPAQPSQKPREAAS